MSRGAGSHEPSGSAQGNGPGGSAPGGGQRGPDVTGIALGLLSLVVALLSLAHQLLGVGIDGEWVGTTAAIAVGGVLVLIGLAGLIRRR